MPDEVQSLSHRHAVFLPLEEQVHVEFSAAVCLGEKRPVVRTILEEFRHAAKQVFPASLVRGKRKR
jgi:hypothetical protein